MEPFLDRSTGRARSLWRLGIQYWVCFSSSSSACSWSLCLSGLGRAKTHPTDSASQFRCYDAVVLLVSSVAGLVVAIMTVWLAGRFLDRRSPSPEFGFRTLGARWWLDLLFGMVLGVLAHDGHLPRRAGAWLGQVTRCFRDHGGAPFVISAASFVCVGISQEMVSRGSPAQATRPRADLPGRLCGAILLAWFLSSAFSPGCTPTTRMPLDTHKHAQYRPRRSAARLRLCALRRPGHPDRFTHYVDSFRGRSSSLAPRKRLRSFRPRLSWPQNRAALISGLVDLSGPRVLAKSPPSRPWNISDCAMGICCVLQGLTPHPHRGRPPPRPSAAPCIRLVRSLFWLKC